MDIPQADERTSYRTKNSSKETNVNTEQKEKDFTGLFTSYRDYTRKLNPLIEPEFKERQDFLKEKKNLDAKDTNGDGVVDPFEQPDYNNKERRRKKKEKRKNEETKKIKL